jgi:hypothetical protein
MAGHYWHWLLRRATDEDGQSRHTDTVGFYGCGIPKRMGWRMSNLAVIDEALPVEASMESILKFEAVIKTMPQYEPETIHTFFAGMYCREAKLKANQLAVGRVHKKEHLFYIVSGTVNITTPDGIQVITGPAMFKSKPGTKRACHTITDAHFMNIHLAESTNVEDVEKELIVDDPDSMFAPGNILKTNLIGAK